MRGANSDSDFGKDDDKQILPSIYSIKRRQGQVRASGGNWGQSLSWSTLPTLKIM